MPTPEELQRLKDLMRDTAHRTDLTKAGQINKKIDRAKRSAPVAPAGELKPPKQTLYGVLLAMQDLWVSEFLRKFPKEKIATHWGPKQGGQIRAILARYNGNQETVEQGIKYFIRYWEQIQSRFPKMKDVLPTLGLFCAYEETIIPEAHKMFNVMKAKQAYDAWCAANPSATRVPEELQEAYDAVRSDLKTLGF